MSFDEFLYKFVTPGESPAVMAQEMVAFLKEEFAIEYVDDAALGIQIDADRARALSEELEKHKRTKQQASNDAKTILTTYGRREKDNEANSAGIFGFRTWWLSKDTTTHRAVRSCFRDRLLTSCYLRPDFLLNYIALSSRAGSASKVFDVMFPTLIGVSLSHHVTPELSRGVHNAILEHKELPTARIKAVIGSISTRLMSDPSLTGKKLKHALKVAFSKPGDRVDHDPERGCPGVARTANIQAHGKGSQKRPFRRVR
jgi:hypothetical protein